MARTVVSIVERIDSMQYTEYSYLTDDELISKVENKNDATSLEVELASRLQAALDDIEEAEEVIESLNTICEEAGIEISVVESLVQ